MVGETPEAWIGQEVLLHLWKSDGLGTEPHKVTLEGMNTLGITVKTRQRDSLSFYPWSSLREISLGQDQSGG